MLKSLVYKTKYTALTSQEVIALLANPKDEMVSTSPAVSPKHGDIYIYSYKGRPKAKKEWRADQIRWVHLGIHSLPKKDPVIIKTYHQRIMFGKRDKFFRHGYESTDRRISMVVVHYLGEGDEEGGSCGTMESVPPCIVSGAVSSLPEDDHLVGDPIYNCKTENVEAPEFRVYMGLRKNVAQFPPNLDHEKAKMIRSRDNAQPATNSMVYKTKYTALTKQEVIALLADPKDELISTSPASSPKHGDIYLYSYKGRPRAKKGWRADRIQWIHMGVHPLPPKNPVIVKTYHQKTLSGKRQKFFRHGYESTDKRIGMVVVHYLGEGSEERGFSEAVDSDSAPCVPQNNEFTCDPTFICKEENVEMPDFHAYMGLHENTSPVPLKNECEVISGFNDPFAQPEDTLKSIVYETKYTALTKQEVIALLADPNDEMISTGPATSPKHGDIYIYSYKGRPGARKDWRADQIRWIHLGIHSLPQKNPVIVKTYHQKILCGRREKFFRHGYESTDEKISMVVVHYLGEGAGEEGAQGTMESVPQCSHDAALPQDDRLDGDPTYSCKEENIQTPDVYTGLHQDVSPVPHNLNSFNTRRKISRDDLYGIYELNLSLDHFIRNFTLVPEFIIVASLPDIVNIYNEVCSINRHQLLSYDRTFRLGDYYVSPILFNCQLFEEEPSVPLAAVIHDNRSAEVHKTFFRAMKNVTVNFNSSDIRLVTGREWAVASALDGTAPNIKHVLRWDDILKDVETWLAEHKQGAYHATHVRHLLDCESEDDFHRLFECYRKGWSKPFLLYFEENIKSDIVHKSGRWLLTELRIFSPGSGVATNVSDNMDALLGRLAAFREITLEQIVFALYFLQTLYLKDVLRGRSGTGNYRLRGDYGHLAMDSATVGFNDDYFYLTPDDIIAFLESKSWSLNRNVDG